MMVCLDNYKTKYYIQQPSFHLFANDIMVRKAI